jgi:hypothetical protein
LSASWRHCASSKAGKSPASSGDVSALVSVICDAVPISR